MEGESETLSHKHILLIKYSVLNTLDSQVSFRPLVLKIEI